MLRQAVSITGKILIGAGVLVLLFTAYQIWGTSIQESHSQDATAQHADVGDEQPGDPPCAGRGIRPRQDAHRPAGHRPEDWRPHTRASPIGDIRIPVIGINQVVVEGTNTPDLRKGPGHYTGTPLPGQNGNAVDRRAPHHLRPSLLQPGRRQGRRSDRRDDTAGHLRLRHDQESFVVSPSDTSVINNVFANLPDAHDV